MKYEKLSSGSNNKKVFLYGFITCAMLLIVFNLFMSYAKYKSIDSVKLASGTITYSSADLNVIAMYKNNGEGTKDEPIEKIPDGSYVIDDTKSYCIIGNDKNNRMQNVFEYKDKKVYIAIDQKGTKCYVYFRKINTPSEQTLANLFKGFTTADSGTNFSTGSNEVLNVTGVDEGDNGKTLYKAEDNDGTSYFFRGQANNNWVKFAGNRWRIIRINGDGTIRIIFQCSGADCTNTTDAQSQEAQTQLTRLAYNSEYGDNTYVGYYNFGQKSKTYEEAHTGINPSTIAAYLNDWYGNNLTQYDQYIDQEAGFCNDRQKVTGVNSSYNDGIGAGSSATSYAAWGRVVKNGINRNPQFPTLKCGVSAATTTEQETSVEVDNTAYKRDLFTKTGAKKGNQLLEHPIGLITADEVLLAGGFYGSVNSTYYLYTNQYYWTMSPATFSAGSAYGLRVHDNGYFQHGEVNNPHGVRPVINLKADTTFSGGTGDVNDPFVVKTN